MTVVPNFLLKRIYIAGSLRNTNEGAAFDLKNILGPGLLTRFNSITIDGVVYEADQVVLKNPVETRPAVGVTDETPLMVKMGQQFSVVITGLTLSAGPHTMVLDVVTKEAGKVAVTLSDSLT